MRLHLDTTNYQLPQNPPADAKAGQVRPRLDTTGTTELKGTQAPLPGAGTALSGLTSTGTSDGPDSDSGSADSVSVSSATSAWATSFTDRAARVGQLTAAVQSGTYQIPSSAASQAIVVSATAAG